MTARRLVQVTAVIVAQWLIVGVGLIAGRRPSAEQVGVRLRQTCERLGVTYIKLGQYLATRQDLLPIAVCRELARLFDRAPAVPFAAIRAQVEAELRCPLEQAFTDFSLAPIGSASVAQVHRALTTSGRDVAVKVRRPGVLRVFYADAALMRGLTRAIDAFRSDEAFRAHEIAEEFLRFTAREFDFGIERRTMQQAATESSGHLRIPEVLDDLSSSAVLTLEFIDGITYAEAISIRERAGDAELARQLPGVDLGEVARTVAWGFLHQLFVVGHFQADPHPGNIIIGRDGSVSLVDFGIFGRLTPDRLESLSQYVENLARGNISAAIHNYRSVLVYTSGTDRTSFRAELTTLLTGFYNANDGRTVTASERRHLGRFSDDLLILLYRNRVRLELDTVLFWRTLIVLDASSLQVMPDFDLNTLLRDFFLTIRPDPVARTLMTLARASRATAETLADECRHPELVRVLAGPGVAMRVLISRSDRVNRLVTTVAVVCLCLALLRGRL